ncbi:MAG TPA: DUF2130 domain-containing protein [Syntrophorhabdaceae bacterium]|nr:DUF2130 domain-containing protein [Syntrophorhabdaceae bacterium]
MKQIGTTIICPHCKKEIPLDEALTHQIRETLQKELNEEITKREVEFGERLAALTKDKEEFKKLKEKQEKDFEAEKEKLRTRYDEDLKKALEKAGEAAKKKAEEALAVELKSLREEVEEKGRVLKEFQTKEFELRKEKRKLEEEKENMGLEIERKLDSERQKIREETSKRFVEQQTLKDREKDMLIDSLKKKAEELQQKLEQGSQERQGETLELVLEDLLRAKFPQDTIEPVPKGMKGADLIQKVCSSNGQICGTIIWESKRTKAWSDGWIDKLKEDQREAKADIAVIISTVLPKDISDDVDNVKGVWVTNFPLAVGLAMALRSGVIEIAMAKQGMVGKSEKMEMLYGYLSGSEFRQQIEGIVEAFASLKKDLDHERNAMEKIWAKREKQIERVIKSTGRMYGSLQYESRGQIFIIDKPCRLLVVFAQWHGP